MMLNLQALSLTLAFLFQDKIFELLRKFINKFTFALIEKPVCLANPFVKLAIYFLLNLAFYLQLFP